MFLEVVWGRSWVTDGCGEYIRGSTRAFLVSRDTHKRYPAHERSKISLKAIVHLAKLIRFRVPNEN